MSTQNEKPIIFSSEMVRAILENRKSQTRRVIKPQPTRNHHISHIHEQGICGYYGFAELTYYASVVRQIKCPFGKAGDRLWVRETWCNINKPQYKPEIYYKEQTLDAEDYDPTEWKWKPSIHLPYCWHRIDLEITAIRVERLQSGHGGTYIQEGYVNQLDSSNPAIIQNWFQNLWNSIHKKQYRWEDNPWVWVISFKVAKNG